MRRITLVLSAVLATTAADAASYQKTDGTIVNPIQNRIPFGGDHPYVGNNLEPGANLVGADLTQAGLVEADFAGADLTNAILIDASLNDADFSDAVLLGAAFNQSDIMGMNATGADMRGADLTLAHAPETSFRGADLTGAILSTLDGRNADLFGAILVNATMDMASLNGADLQDTCLTCANITLTNFRGADLYRADFENAYYYNNFMPYGEFHWESMGVLRMTWPDVPEACQTAAVPEPAAILLALVGLARLPRRRKSPTPYRKAVTSRQE